MGMNDPKTTLTPLNGFGSKSGYNSSFASVILNFEHTLPPATCNFSHATQRKCHFEAYCLKMAIFPVSRGENRMLQRVEKRGLTD